MLPKQIAYVLFSVIALLSIFFGYSIYTNYKSKLDTEKKISTIIFQFEEKFKNDSIYLANANKLLIDQISQHIIDSISTSYEKKLENAILEANKYKQLLLANNIKIKNEELIIPESPNLNHLNITTYSKLGNNTKPQRANTSNILNITTISKIEKQKSNSYANVTTYTKKATIKESIQKENTSNVTTYSKLNYQKNYTVTKNKKSNTVSPSLKKKTKGNLKHNNYILDHAENLNDLDAVPIYKGCESYHTESERKNCFAINISKHIFNQFSSLKIKNSGLQKQIHKVRVLFIIDEQGNAKIGKLVGKWPHQIYKNVKFAVESVPQMKPGYSNNKAISVKYSLLIPFIIK